MNLSERIGTNLNDPYPMTCGYEFRRTAMNSQEIDGMEEVWSSVLHISTQVSPVHRPASGLPLVWRKACSERCVNGSYLSPVLKAESNLEWPRIASLNPNI